MDPGQDALRGFKPHLDLKDFRMARPSHRQHAAQSQLLAQRPDLKLSKSAAIS